MIEQYRKLMAGFAEAAAGPTNAQYEEYEQFRQKMIAGWAQLDSSERSGVIVELLEIHDANFWFLGELKCFVAVLCKRDFRFPLEMAVRAVKAMGRWPFGAPYQHVFGAIEGLDLVPELREELLQLRSAVNRMRIGNVEAMDWHQRINLLLGETPTIGESARGSWLKKVLADSIGNAQWAALLEHCGEMSGSVASKKWSVTAKDLIGRLERQEFLSRSMEWLDMGPTMEDRDVTVPEPDASYQKGFVWCVAIDGDGQMASHLGDFAVGCYRKITGLGAVSQKVGNASIQALAAMPGLVPVAQLSRLAGSVKYDMGRRLIEKSLNEAASRNGLSRDALEAMSVPKLGLDANGVRIERGESWEGYLMATAEGGLLEWYQAGKLVKKAPTEGKELKQAKKELDGLLDAQRFRLEGMLLSRSEMSGVQLRELYLEHPVVGVHARRLIWELDGVPVIAWQGQMIEVSGAVRPLLPEARVKLWHPVEWDVATVLSWRCWFEDHPVRQPFKQAHREVYLLTEAERETRTFSRRFAAHIVKQHPFAALCRERGWTYKLMGDFDSHNNAVRVLPQWGLEAVLEMDYGNPKHQPAVGILMEARTGNLRFQRNREAVCLEDTPKGVLTEVMRDVDLFIGVSRIGNDPYYGMESSAMNADYWSSYAFGDLTEAALVRREVLERILPKLSIGKVCQIEGRYLHVRGKLHEYKIHLGSGNVLMGGSGRYLCIVQNASDVAGRVMLPFERDGVMETILSKAILLAEDGKIRDETILKQLRA